MKLQKGEQLILEARRSKVTWLWPILQAVLLGTIAFGFFWGFLYLLDSFFVAYDSDGHPMEASFSLSLKSTSPLFLNRELRAGAMLALLLLACILGKFALWMRRRRKAKNQPQVEALEVEPDLTSEMSDRALRRIAIQRMVRHFRFEKLITKFVLLGVLAFFLLVLKLSLFFNKPHTAAIFYGVTVLVAALVYRYICWHHTHYCLTNRRFFTVCGWFSRNVWEIPLAECRHIEGKRNFFQKMFGYGHLTISGVGSISEYLPYVPRPDKLREAIRNALSGQAEAEPDAPAGGDSLDPQAETAAPMEENVAEVEQSDAMEPEPSEEPVARSAPLEIEPEPTVEEPKPAEPAPGDEPSEKPEDLSDEDLDSWGQRKDDDEEDDPWAS